MHNLGGSIVREALVFSCKLNLLGSIVDLVKLDLVLMHLPFFTLEGAKLSYPIDPFHTMRDFIPTHGTFTHFIHLLDDISKN